MTTNKPEFLEDYASPHQDPLADSHVDFDYEQVYRDLDGETEADWQDDDLNQKLVQVLKRIFEYVVDTEIREGADRRIGRRFLALAWVLNPALFAGSPSLISLSKSIQIDPATMARLTSEASETFGIANRSQARWAKQRRAKANSQAQNGPTTSQEAKAKASTPEIADERKTKKESFNPEYLGQGSQHSSPRAPEKDLSPSHATES